MSEKLVKLTFPQMLEKYKEQIVLALPKHLEPKRILRIVMTAYHQTPKLQQCDPRSVFAAAIMAAQLGLEPGVMGDGWLIPYKSTCQFIPGYQGLVKLIRNAGAVSHISAQVVYEGEAFTYRQGLAPTLEHVPSVDGERGKLRLVYAIAFMREGGMPHIEVMSRADVERIRDRSEGYRASKRWGKDTPWETDEAEMWRKTAVRRIAKMLPKSGELATALALDDAAGRGTQRITMEEAIEGHWLPAPDPAHSEEVPAAIEQLNAEGEPSQRAAPGSEPNGEGGQPTPGLPLDFS